MNRHESKQQTGLGIIGKQSAEVGGQRPLSPGNPDRFPSRGIIERQRGITYPPARRSRGREIASGRYRDGQAYP